MMPKSYYVVIFFMLLAIIFLLIYIASNISWIKATVKCIDKYQDENHYRFIRILDNTSNTNQKIDELYELKDFLDAKMNFIEGLNYGKDKKEDRNATERNA